MCEKIILIFLALVSVSMKLITSEAATFYIDETNLKKFEEKIDKVLALNENFRIRWDMLQMRLEVHSELLNGLNQKVDLILKSNPKTACINPLSVPTIDVRSSGESAIKVCPTSSDMLPRNCFEATLGSKKSGIYKIQTRTHDKPHREFFASCDAETQEGGWTVVLRRKDGSIDFFRNLADYEQGFGNLEGEFFIGLEKLHELTNDSLQELLIVMEDFDNVVRYAKYDTFAIGSAKELYELNVLGKFSGDAGDSLTEHAGAPFGAKDADHDTDPQSNCATTFTGGWWYKHCHVSNLMGQYLRGAYNQDQFAKGVVWKAFRGYNYSLKYVQMMIRPKK